MKALIQRVKKASCKSEDGFREIKKGIVVFLGISPFDTKKEISFFVSKILKLRIFEDENCKMNLSVRDISGDILVISQFTLYADLLKGNRPSFINAAKGDFAKDIYEKFLKELRKSGLFVEKGFFGKKMEVVCVNDGPAGFIL